MAYNWTNGELITAEKLNSTGGGGVLEIQLEQDETLETMNKTWNEINIAFSAGTLCFVLWPEGSDYERDMVVEVGCHEYQGTKSECKVTIARQDCNLAFQCNSPNDYPYYSFD